MIKNSIININSQCQLVFLPWNDPIVTENLSDTDLTFTTLLDISRYVQEISFTKDLGNPAGTFQLKLPNDRDWKQTLHPGTWGVLYMSNDSDLAVPNFKTDGDRPDMNALRQQKDKIRAILYIDRISVTGRVGEERGEYDAEFIVSGRDFGVVYVENEIFYNRTQYEGKIQDAAAGALTASSTKTVADLLDILHQIFFSPDELPGMALLGGTNLQKDIPKQWLLPWNLFLMLDLPSRDGQHFFGSIPRDNLLNFDDTLATFPAENPMTQINGKAWDRLKSFSIEPFHELFTETNSDGQPQLNFRYIPWKTSDGTSLGKLNDLVKSMSIDSAVDPEQGVDRVNVDSINILDFDLGEENHNRYNYFFTVIDSSLYDANSTTASLADNDPRTGFPRIQANSVKRYGLRLMYTTVNSLYFVGSEQTDPDLMRLHNELMFEYWNNSVFMESGTMTIIGNNDVKVGKVLKIADDVPYNGGKVFYIESYTDHFSVDEKGAGLWTQSLTLTRGYFPGSIGSRGEDYVDSGEFTPTGGK